LPDPSFISEPDLYRAFSGSVADSAVDQILEFFLYSAWISGSDLGIALGMLRSGTDTAKTELPDQLGKALFPVGHAKTFLHQGTEIAEPKADHSMLGEIRPSLDDGNKFLLLRLAQTTRRAQAWLAV